MPLEYSTGDTISLLPRVLNYLNRLLFVVGIATATISIISVIALAFLGAGSQRILFPLVFDANLQESFFVLGIGLFFAMGTAYVVIITLSRFGSKSAQIKPNNQPGAMAILLVAFANIFPVVVAIVLWIIPNQFRSTFANWTLINSITFENADYHVAYYTPDSTEGQFDYYLYACDTRDLLCAEIYHESAFSISERLGNFDIHAATLTPDFAAHTVTLQINGESVYVHPVK